MITYSKYPFLRLLIVFIAGIFLYEFYPFGISTWLILFIIIVFSLPVFIIPIQGMHKSSFKWITGISLHLCLLVLGYYLSMHKTYDITVPDLNRADAVVCRITQTPVEKTRSYKSEGFLQSALINGKWEPVNHKIIIYSPIGDSILWQYDDIVLLKSPIQFPKEPANPHQFNYKKYLAKNGIYYQTYVKRDDVTWLDKDRQFTLSDMAEYCVQYTRNVCRNVIPDEDLAAVATALLVGYQEELDPETKTSFSRVGAMHILAVSGLHVGVIFILLSNLLFVLNRNKYTKILKAVILIGFLWGYALIAGFSPSIVRAALMFTLLIPIISFQVRGNAYNNISSSAFILLIYQPSYLFDVGFLLSYVAVFGIIFLFPYMKRWIRSEYWLIRNIWQLTAVSLAATIFTTPIVLFYFGQFPLSFWLSNLIAVPLSTFIIYIGLIALFAVHIPILGWIVGKTLYYSLWILRESIQWIEALPFAYIDHLMINRWQVYLLYILLFTIISFFMYRQAATFKWMLVLLSVFVVTLIIRRYEVSGHRELYVYHLNKNSYVEFIDGHYAVNIFNKELSEMEYGLFVRTNHQSEGVFWRVNAYPDVMVNRNAFQIGNIRFYMIEGKVPVSGKPLELDYLLLSQIRYLDVMKLKENFRFKGVILLNNHSTRQLTKFKELLTDADIPFYSVADSGCYRYKVE